MKRNQWFRPPTMQVILFLVVVLLVSGWPALASTVTVPFGINYNSFGSDPTPETVTFPIPVLPQIRQAGIPSVRITLRWKFIEGTNGVFNWDHADPLVEAAEENGFTIVAAFTEPPDWISPDDPNFVGEYREFVSAVASRFVGRISYYSPHNEPNVFFRDYGVSVYLALLYACHDAIETVDPAAKLFGPETVFDLGRQWFESIVTYDPTPPAPGDPNPVPSGDEACQLFDAIAAHFYPGHLGGYVGAAQDMFTDIDTNYLPVISDYQCSGKPFWVTEFGVFSVPTPEDDDLDEEGQADEYEAAYLGVLDRPRVERLYLFRTHDQPHPSQPEESRYYGILGNETYSNPPPPILYPEKPSFWRIRDLIAEIRRPRVVTVDASFPPFYVVLDEQSDTETTWITGDFEGTDSFRDCAWGPANDYKDFPGMRLFVSHLGPPNSTCGAPCEPGTQQYEESDWLGIHIDGLRTGALYRVYVRFLTIAGHSDLRGIRAGLPDVPGWTFQVFDQNSPPQNVRPVREWDDGTYLWEEWEAYLGDSSPVSGELTVFFDDAANDGSCILYESSVSRVRLETTIPFPYSAAGGIFFDGFESGDTIAWSEVEP